jgi:hypothetical protein
MIIKFTETEQKLLPEIISTKLSTTKQKCDLHAHKYDRFWQSFLEAAVSSYDPYQHS